jgi:DNA-binding winged helix-turn-helix (wHTH) protein/Tol biopolymer transport system component
MQKLAHEIYSFDEFRLDLTRGALFRGTVELKLRPKSFEVLRYLAENHGRLVGKEELIGTVWSDTAVTDDSLVQCLKDIRQVLGDVRQEIVKTVPRRGYIFEKKTVYTEEISGVHMIIEETEETNGGHPVISSTELRTGVGSQIAARRPRKLVLAISMASLLIVAGGIAYGVFVFLSRQPVSPYRPVTMRGLTTDGNAIGADISPDGKYFVYSSGEGGKASLWVRQISEVNGVQIGEPSAQAYNGLKFSPDGNSVYYRQGDTLFSTGTLGGSIRKIAEKVDTKITFSPDGKRIAFIRSNVSDELGTRLVLANADGSGDEQIIAYRKTPDLFTVNGCIWSPDGTILVCPVGDNRQFGQQYPLGLRATDGNARPITTRRWNLVRPSSWLADGSGFVMTAWDNLDSGAQIWHVTYPAGIATRIYSDLNDYRAASLASDGKTLLAIQRQSHLNIHAVSLSGNQKSRQLTFATSGRNGFECVTSTPDGNIIYSSEAGSTRDLWIMSTDGTGQRRLTFDEPMESSVVLAPDGSSFVYAIAGKGIWRADIDGGNRRQLTEYGMFPAFSADGRSVFYTLPRERWTLWRVPIEGGDSIRVTEHAGIQPAVSPDGKWIAYMTGNVSVKPILHIMPIDGGDTIAFDALPADKFDIQWLPDGKEVAYKITENGIQKIVSQSVVGGQPRTLLAALGESEGIAGWAFSIDGKELYYSTGPVHSNVVMFALERQD